MWRSTTLFSVLIFLFATGCTVFNRDKSVPSFIRIDSIAVHVPEPAGCLQCPGTQSNKITDAWVYVNDNLVGIYEVPVTVPIYASGKTNIKIGAGIKNNGISNTHVLYPFYDFFQADVNLIPTATIDFSHDSATSGVSWKRHYPVVEYFQSGLHFWNENFQDVGVNMVVTANSDTSLERTTDPAEAFQDEYGALSKSGIVHLTADKPYFECKPYAQFAFPHGAKVYVELNYKSNCPIQVGLYTVDPSVQKSSPKGILPSAKWNKIYIELTNEVVNYTSTHNFEVYLEAQKPDSVAEGKVLIDNVKVIYAQ